MSLQAYNNTSTMDLRKLADDLHPRLYKATIKYLNGNDDAFKSLPKAIREAIWNTYLPLAFNSASSEQKQSFLTVLSFPGSASCDHYVHTWSREPFISGPVPKQLGLTELARKCPLGNGRRKHTRQSSIVYTLGKLDKLPTEILQETLLEYIDLESLTALRSVNRGLRSFIDGTPKYKALIEHGASAIRGALSLKVGSFLSYGHLYNQLVKSSCGICGDFAPFFHLLTFERTRLNCVQDAPTSYALELDQACDEWWITPEDVKNAGVPIAKMVCGNSSNANALYSKISSRRPEIVLSLHVRDASVKKRGKTVDYLETRRAEWKAGAEDRYDAELDDWLEEAHNTEIRRDHPQRPKDYDRLSVINPYRRMCIVPFPVVQRDESGDLVSWGMNCIGCDNLLVDKVPIAIHGGGLHESVRVMIHDAGRCYSEEAFFEHFPKCDEAQKILKNFCKQELGVLGVSNV